MPVELIYFSDFVPQGIKQYIDWYMAGDSTLPQRLEMFKEQKSRLLEQMAQLQKHMEKIDYKIAYYEEIIARGEQGIWDAVQN